MKTRKRTTLWPALFAAIALTCTFADSARAQGTAFSYQGRLTLSSVPVSGNWDMQFKLYDAPVSGTQIGSTLTIAPVPVNSGLFTVTLDFGNGAFNGAGRWIEVGARANGSPSGYTNMVPRVAVLPAPYAINAAVAANGVPPGSVVAFMGTTIPPGWLLCDGTAINRTNYAALFSVIGTSSGTGDGTTTFNLPDLRGMFLRGVNGSRIDIWQDPEAATRLATAVGGYPGNNVGSIQGDATRRPNLKFTTDNPGNHTHTFGMRVDGSGGATTPEQGSGSASGTATTSAAGGHTHDIVGGGDIETRPKNAYVHYIIKY